VSGRNPYDVQGHSNDDAGRSPSWRINSQIVKELLLTFLTGILLFFAFGLLFDQDETEAARPVSTVYGEF
jgi:hypothetical protein